MKANDNTQKLTLEHLARKAVVYLRQSSMTQVRHNQESQRLQYALRYGQGLWLQAGGSH